MSLEKSGFDQANDARAIGGARDVMVGDGETLPRDRIAIGSVREVIKAH